MEWGNVTPPFTRDEIERARRYHRPLYRSLLLDLALGGALLGCLAFRTTGNWLYAAVRGLPWPAAALAFSALVVALSGLVRLPLSFWRGFLHERRWGFSTQGIGGWLADRAKGLAVGLVLTSALLLGFLTVARAFPAAWPAVAAPTGAAVVLLLSFVAPVILEPIFNRFAPLADPSVAEDLRTLAERAGVPVRDVLVADASRRTRKENAYVSGLGRTRRIVLFDTLLARARPEEVRLVTAHELGHRRMRHVLLGTALGMAGMVVGVLVLWALLSSRAVLDAVGATGAGNPRVIPFVLLVGAGLQLVGAPFEAALSRWMESAADRFSLVMTGDAAAFEVAHHDLAVSNLSDLDPPRSIYLLVFSHPTPPERIAAARRWAAELVRGRSQPGA